MTVGIGVTYNVHAHANEENKNSKTFRHTHTRIDVIALNYLQLLCSFVCIRMLKMLFSISTISCNCKECMGLMCSWPSISSSFPSFSPFLSCHLHHHRLPWQP